jgi:hypothetical protein
VAAIWTDEGAARWLLDLLGLLPAMNAGVRDLGRRRFDLAVDPNDVESDGAEWWDRYATAHQGPTGDGGYYRSHLLSYALAIVKGKADEETTRRLAEYCLLFFDVADRAECCELLAEQLVGTCDPRPAGSLGRLWARSVMEAAWRLWVPREARSRQLHGEGPWPHHWDD